MASLNTASGRAGSLKPDQGCSAKAGRLPGEGAGVVLAEAQAAARLPGSTAQAAAALSWLWTRAELRFLGCIFLLEVPGWL